MKHICIRNVNVPYGTYVWIFSRLGHVWSVCMTSDMIAVNTNTVLTKETQRKRKIYKGKAISMRYNPGQHNKILEIEKALEKYLNVNFVGQIYIAEH